MSSATLTLKEAIAALSVSEQEAIKVHWGKSIASLATIRQECSVIAMLKQREGMNIREAWHAAKTLGPEKTSAYFIE